MGTPEFAAPSLRMLIDEGYDLAAVVTQPDRPKGRGGKLASPIIKDIAMQAGIRVFQPEKPSDIYDEIEALSIDLCVTAAYGKILRKRFLRIPKLGTINVHASLLPLYRGPSPIHMALLNGDAETGVTIMLTDAGVDTGPLLMRESVPIAPEMYFPELHDKLAELGASVLKKAIPAMLSGSVVPKPQDNELATCAPIIQKSDGELDFSMNADRLVNMVRAFCIWPGAVARVNGTRVRVHRAENGGRADLPGMQPGMLPGDIQVNASEGSTHVLPGAIMHVGRSALSILCGDGNLFNITRLQLENGRAMNISECWHNLPFTYQ